MSLSNKYHIPQETVSKMVKDGVIYPKAVLSEDIFTLYKSLRSDNPNKTKTEIYYMISEQQNMNFFSVKEMIYRHEFPKSKS